MINTETLKYSTVDVPVAGGDLRVGIWEPTDAPSKTDILLIHGVTASHRAFDLLASQLSGARIIAPDLRGRGRSANVAGASSMATHADDMKSVLDALSSERATVVGHSMGGFVGLVLAHRSPQKVSNLVLVDGGLPLEVKEGLTPDQIIESILGPTAQRLAMTFKTPEEYFEFWKQHPGLGPYWSDFLEEYCRYDLEGEPGNYRPATKYSVARDDTVDLNSGDAFAKALTERQVRTHLVTCPRGILDQPPGLFSDKRVEQLMEWFPGVTHEKVLDVNHYTIVMTEKGAAATAKIIKNSIQN